MLCLMDPKLLLYDHLHQQRRQLSYDNIAPQQQQQRQQPTSRIPTTNIPLQQQQQQPQQQQYQQQQHFQWQQPQLQQYHEQPLVFPLHLIGLTGDDISKYDLSKPQIMSESLDDLLMEGLSRSNSHQETYRPTKQFHMNADLVSADMMTPNRTFQAPATIPTQTQQQPQPHHRLEYFDSTTSNTHQQYQQQQQQQHNYSSNATRLIMNDHGITSGSFVFTSASAASPRSAAANAGLQQLPRSPSTSPNLGNISPRTTSPSISMLSPSPSSLSPTSSIEDEKVKKPKAIRKRKKKATRAATENSFEDQDGFKFHVYHPNVQTRKKRIPNKQYRKDKHGD